MKTPPFFIGATLLLWGYERNLLLLGILLSLLVEGAQFIKTRWHLGQEDYVKISDLSSVLFLAAVALIVMNYKARYLLITVSGWLPLTLLPLILAQVYGADDKIIIGTRIGSRNKPHVHRPMDFSFAYAAATLFSTATANSRHEAFFPLFFILAGWFLFGNRGKAFSLPTFCSILSLALFLGFFGIRGMEKGYATLNRMMLQTWEIHFHTMGADPFKSHTSFGDITRLKLSGKILIRLQSSSQPPTLLKEAGYNVFSKGFWFNRDRDFSRLSLGKDNSWQLLDPLSEGSLDLRLESYFAANKGILPLPYGAEEIHGLNIVELLANGEGIVRFEEGEILQRYDVSYAPHRISHAVPADYHLLVTEEEEPALQQIVNELELASLPAEERLQKILGFFRSNFSYTLDAAGKGDHATPVANFLLHRKRGHCELFATATALLLREASIPSRYITGYAVSEKSLLGQGYIIRNRHAHAWVEAYIQGQWLSIDTTPANWLEEEKSGAFAFEPIRDFFSFLRHQMNLFRAREDKKYNLPLSIAVILLSVFLIFRIYGRLNKEKKVKQGEKKRKTFQAPDSPFTLIEETLNQKGPKRRANEAFGDWLVRIDGGRWRKSCQLLSLHSLHQKLRFDPEGIRDEEMVQLRAGVEQWLRENMGTDSPVK
ncbi:MAG: transglutaminase-like domain-containing protein [Thermodesulfobacteriota bacterium]